MLENKITSKNFLNNLFFLIFCILFISVVVGSRKISHFNINFGFIKIYYIEIFLVILSILTFVKFILNKSVLKDIPYKKQLLLLALFFIFNLIRGILLYRQGISFVFRHASVFYYGFFAIFVPIFIKDIKKIKFLFYVFILSSIFNHFLKTGYDYFYSSISFVIIMSIILKLNEESNLKKFNLLYFILSFLFFDIIFFITEARSSLMGNAVCFGVFLIMSIWLRKKFNTKYLGIKFILILFLFFSFMKFIVPEKFGSFLSEAKTIREFTDLENQEKIRLKEEKNIEKEQKIKLELERQKKEEEQKIKIKEARRIILELKNKKAEIKPIVEEKKAEIKPIVEEKKEEIKPIVEEKKAEIKPIVEEKKEEIKPIVEEKKVKLEKEKQIAEEKAKLRQAKQILRQVELQKQKEQEKIIVKKVKTQEEIREEKINELRAKFINTSVGNIYWRLYVWGGYLQESFKTFKSALLGYGFGRKFYPDVLPYYRFGGNWWTDGWQDPHNSFIYIIFMMGLLGFLAYLWFLISIFKDMFKIIANTKSLDVKIYTLIICLSLFYMLGNALFMPGLISPYFSIFFWIFIGFFFVIKNIEEQHEKTN